MSTFSKRLRELRKEKQLTGEDLGKVFNVTKTAISYWENGKTFPDELTIKQMADYFDVSTDFLLGVSDIRNPYKEENKDKPKDEIITIAAHHDGDEYTDEDKRLIEDFKKLVLSRKKNK